MFNKIQESINEQILQYGGYWTELQMITRLIEENGELSRAINITYGSKKKKYQSDGREIKEELSDVLYTVVAIANYYQLDLDKEFSTQKGFLNKNIGLSKKYKFKDDDEPFKITCNLNINISRLFKNTLYKLNNKKNNAENDKDIMSLKKNIIYIIKEVFVIAKTFNINVLHELGSKMNKDFEERLKDKIY